MDDPALRQKLGAEVIGTFVLVFIGCGSAVYAGAVGAFGDLTTITTVGLAFGIAVMVMVYAFGRVSGGHFNPAVSVGAGVSGRMPWNQVGAYVLAQLGGAILGALALFLLLHGFDGFDAEGNMGQNSYGGQGSGYAWWAAFLLEALLTAIFVLVILAVTDERNEHPALAPLAIGLTFAAVHFVAVPATGTSVNPARSIGPALFAGGDAIIQLWLFILAPTVGAAVAGLGYPALFGRASDAVPGSGLRFARPRAAVLLGPDQYQQQWNQEPHAGSSPWSSQGSSAGSSAGAYTGTYAGSSADRSAGSWGAQHPAYGQPGAQAEPAPIVQDGWQWDPAGQQWHPVGQTPEQWRAQQAAQERVDRKQSDEPADESAGPQRWPESEPGDGGTHIRPPAP